MIFKVPPECGQCSHEIRRRYFNDQAADPSKLSRQVRHSAGDLLRLHANRRQAQQQVDHLVLVAGEFAGSAREIETEPDHRPP
jgi:hypothetical protein